MSKTVWNGPEPEGYSIRVEAGTTALPAEPIRPAGEFDHFQKLANTLLKVPKSELDEKREN
ncbi:MAG: hypothetical protein M3R70_07890 [Actinomycetota bacterium]|nr:hypothetical protein [Actinomycetota bacterium]